VVKRRGLQLLLAKKSAALAKNNWPAGPFESGDRSLYCAALPLGRLVRPRPDVAFPDGPGADRQVCSQKMCWEASMNKLLKGSLATVVTAAVAVESLRRAKDFGTRRRYQPWLVLFLDGVWWGGRRRGRVQPAGVRDGGRCGALPDRPDRGAG
jgi:hypothetical protein